MRNITSRCEEKFVTETICKGHRVDGRNLHDGRNVEITFGSNGCCIVMLDNTRVLAQVSCEIVKPKESRPSEGTLHINLELSSMAASNLQVGRTSETGVEASRLLERCIRDSKCIDLESLCIVAGIKVWCVRVIVQVLNDDGNVIECSSIAAISALSHFKRPHVSVVGTEVTLHSLDDHNPVPLTLHHMPVIVSLALYNAGHTAVVDPSELEERVADGKIVIGVNAHQEVCCLHLSGPLMLKKDKILQCTNIAVKRAQLLSKKIRDALDHYSYEKATNKETGFAELLHSSIILGAKHTITQTTFGYEEEVENEEVLSDECTADMADVDMSTTYPAGENLVKVKKFFQRPEVALFEGGASRWYVEEDEESDDSSDDAALTSEKNQSIKESSSDDEKVFLPSGQVDIKDEKAAASRGWYKKDDC